MSVRKLILGLFLLVAIASCSKSIASSQQQSQAASQDNQSQTASTQATQFTVRIENITTADQFTATTGAKWSLGFSPGAWFLHTNENSLFVDGQRDKGQGLEAQSEDGKPDQLVRSLQGQEGIVSSGVFNTPAEASKPGPIRPGEVYEFVVTATPGDKLSLTMMFGQSNDWFYAPSGKGISLFDASGNPMSGDITSEVQLWNAGTEVDQEPGIGLQQGPRQKSDNTGEAENGVVQLVKGYPAFQQPSDVMCITITPQS